jgi:hypothetical protein
MNAKLKFHDRLPSGHGSCHRLKVLALPFSEPRRTLSENGRNVIHGSCCRQWPANKVFVSKAFE